MLHPLSVGLCSKVDCQWTRTMYAWQVSGGGCPLWTPRSWTIAPPVLPLSRVFRLIGHRRVTGLRAWGPQGTNMVPPPPLESSQAYMDHGPSQYIVWSNKWMNFFTPTVLPSGNYFSSVRWSLFPLKAHFCLTKWSVFVRNLLIKCAPFSHLINLPLTAGFMKVPSALRGPQTALSGLKTNLVYFEWTFSMLFWGHSRFESTQSWGDFHKTGC